MPILNETDIDKIRKLLNPSLSKNLLRGQSNSVWSLTSSFFRKNPQLNNFIHCKDFFGPYQWNCVNPNYIHPTDDDKPLRTSFPYSIDKNSKGLAAFPQLYSLVIQQHNGILPTPLLDVSYDVEMPLYCACKEDWDKDGKLYVLNIDNSDSIGLDDFESSIFYIEDGISPYNRLIKQKGMFIKTIGWTSQQKTGFAGLAFGDISISKNIKIDEYIIPKVNKQIILYNLAQKINSKQKIISLYDYFGSL